MDIENKTEDFMEKLKEALAVSTQEQPEISFASDEDQSTNFPNEVDGWKIIRRSGHLVPRHYMNSAVYTKINGGKDAEETKETSTDV
jgi:hypothetical protein